MTHVYRFTAPHTKASVLATGELQHAEGCYIVVAQTTYADAVALQEMAKGRQVTVWIEVGGVGVAFMPVSKIRAKEQRGAFVEVWALVHVPDPWTGLVKT